MNPLLALALNGVKDALSFFTPSRLWLWASLFTASVLWGQYQYLTGYHNGEAVASAACIKGMAEAEKKARASFDARAKQLEDIIASMRASAEKREAQHNQYAGELEELIKRKPVRSACWSTETVKVLNK